MREITFGEALFTAIYNTYYHKLMPWHKFKDTDITNWADRCMLELMRLTYEGLNNGEDLYSIITKTYPGCMMNHIHGKGLIEGYTREDADEWVALILKEMEKYL